MAAFLGATEAELPRWFRVLFVPIAGFLLILFFVIRGFPYGIITDRVISSLEPALGIQLDIVEFGPSFGWAGPGLEAEGVRATFPDAKTLSIDRMMVRPAWTTAWFRGDQAFHIELESPSGSATGAIEVGESPSWEGSIENLDLAEVSMFDAVPSGAIQGRMDATFSLQEDELGAKGPVTFEMRDGSLSVPDVPVALPFQKITGKLELGGDAYLTIESLILEGPIVSGSGNGTIAKAATFALAPLRMEFDLNVKPALAGGVRSAGMRVNSKGDTKVRISGTVASPQLR